MSDALPLQARQPAGVLAGLQDRLGDYAALALVA